MKIIITGSEGLLGTEISRYLAQKNQVINLDLNLGHDLTNEDFVKKWFKDNNADCLVNCFALNDHVEEGKKRGTFYDITLESFNKFLEVNLTALFSVCREFARNTNNGTIINFSSTYGVVSPNPNLYTNSMKDIAYGVTKAAVINLTKYLAVHLAPKIRVNTVAPGGIRFNQNKKFVSDYSKLTPMKRMMEKNELNELISYLSSKNSSYVTGSTIVCDGGYTIW